MLDSLTALHQLQLGGGSVQPRSPSGCRLIIPPAPKGYADAQLDDTAGVARGKFAWRPPALMEVRARASSPEPAGTLGFGFWNDPFAFAWGLGGTGKFPAPPRALWFFYGSPPNDFSFARGAAGFGWKAMSLDSPAIPSLVLAPLAAGALLAARVPVLRPPVVQAVINRVHAAERPLRTSLDEWHTYSIEWMSQEATFRVDGRVVLEAPGPRPPLGLVIWIDNQYAVVSPEKGFAFGTIPTLTEQWLEIQDLTLERPRSHSNEDPPA